MLEQHAPPRHLKLDRERRSPSCPSGRCCSPADLRLHQQLDGQLVDLPRIGHELSTDRYIPSLGAFTDTFTCCLEGGGSWWRELLIPCASPGSLTPSRIHSVEGAANMMRCKGSRHPDRPHRNMAITSIGGAGTSFGRSGYQSWPLVPLHAGLSSLSEHVQPGEGP